MKKDSEMLIKIERELKEEAQKKAKSLGLGLSGFVRMILIERLKS